MARLQQELNGYMQKLVMLVGTKEPYFTVLCGMLDLLPPDPSRLPARDTDILSQMQTRAGGRKGGGGGVGGGGGMDESGHTQNGGSGRRSGTGRGLLSAGRKSSRSSFSGKSSRPSSLRKASPSARSGGGESSGGVDGGGGGSSSTSVA